MPGTDHESSSPTRPPGPPRNGAWAPAQSAPLPAGQTPFLPAVVVGIVTDHEPLVRRTYDLAETAWSNGNFPFGALIAEGDEVRRTSQNTVETARDVTGHPELKLARWAARTLDPPSMADATLYTSTEPCPMCAGAVYWSGIPRVVYGVRAAAAQSVSGSDAIPTMPCEDVFASGGRDIELVGPVLEEEGLAIHRAFWADPPALPFSQ